MTDRIKANFERLQVSSKYQIVEPPANSRIGYFACIYVSKVIKVAESSIEDFDNTVMARNLVSVILKINYKKYRIATTHLESTVKYSAARIEQLKFCIDKMTLDDSVKCSIFGGDLNIRDNEITQSKIFFDDTALKDCWIESGSNPNFCYTWDCSKNFNIDIPKKTLKHRFDRIYYKTIDADFKIEKFEFCGTGVINGAFCHPSDHFGLVLLFKL